MRGLEMVKEEDARLQKLRIKGPLNSTQGLKVQVVWHFNSAIHHPGRMQSRSFCANSCTHSITLTGIDAV